MVFIRLHIKNSDIRLYIVIRFLGVSFMLDISINWFYWMFFG